MTRHLSELLAAVRDGTDPGPFALLRRAGADLLEVLSGAACQVDRLADIPLPPAPADRPATLAVVPYRQVAERGFAFIDDGVPLECIQVSSYERVPVATVMAALPDLPAATTAGGFDIADDEYADLVGTVLRDEIGAGAGANFVLHRTYRAQLAVTAGTHRPAATDDTNRLATTAGTNRTDGPAGGHRSAPTRQGPSAALGAGLSALRRLLRDERGAYWTFLVYTGNRVLVGATPERHVSVGDGLAMMNPISGTLRHPDGEPDLDTVLSFLDDPKEVEELYMVLDEELKMMATVAEHGGQVIGPYLKRMSRLSHTEYLLAGRNCHDVREVLRQTMFAPTVTGSPIENACRVIARYSRGGRRYYAGVLALLGHDADGGQTLDAPILIRAAEIGLDGSVRVPVGATLVRHSTPTGEVAETHAKAAAVLAALGLLPEPTPAPTLPPGTDAGPEAVAGSTPTPPPGADAQPEGLTAGPDDITGPAGTAVTDLIIRREHPAVARALAARNDRLAEFWLRQRSPDALTEPALAGHDALVVDAEDSFTGMLAHLLRALGMRVRVLAWHRTTPADLTQAGLLIAGPGPGDPTDPTDPRMLALRQVVDHALGHGQPLLGVCLGHQVLAGRLGLAVSRRLLPCQGLQREIDFFGTPRRVGFYSSFTAHGADDVAQSRYGPVLLSRDATDGAVHALRGARFAGVQFHPESVLSPDGVTILRELLTGMVVPAGAGVDRAPAD